MLVEAIDRNWPCEANCAPGHPSQLFTENEVLAVRVGEIDLEREKARRRHLLRRYFDQPQNALADRRLEALRALVVKVGIAPDDDVLEAACVDARDAGLRETQIAFVVARHRVRRPRARAAS